MNTVDVIFIGYFAHTSKKISYITNCYQAVYGGGRYYEQGPYGLIQINVKRVNSSEFVSCERDTVSSYIMKIWK